MKFLFIIASCFKGTTIEIFTTIDPIAAVYQLEELAQENGFRGYKSSFDSPRDYISEYEDWQEQMHKQCVELDYNVSITDVNLD